MMEDNFQRLSRSKSGQPVDINHIVFLNQVVVSRISKSQSKHPLLFQVSLVNTRKGLHQDRTNT